MYRMAQGLMSGNGDPVITMQQLLEQWPYMAGIGEQAWLRHILGQEKVDMEVDTNSAMEAKDLHHWTV